MTKKVLRSLYLDPMEAAQLTQRAEDAGCSISEVVSRSLKPQARTDLVQPDRTLAIPEEGFTYENRQGDGVTCHHAESGISYTSRMEIGRAANKAAARRILDDVIEQYWTNYKGHLEMMNRLAEKWRIQRQESKEEIKRLTDETARLTKRQDELIALIANISQTTPLDSEIESWPGQIAALIAEVGTLRARLAEKERQS